MNKYKNIKTVIDNITFDSKKEAARYQELRLLEKAGEIKQLELQPKFILSINGVHIANYFADFSYFTPGKDIRADLIYHVEDVKGIKTSVYNLKKKLVKAIHNIDIEEI